jgi:hypothetical protein
VSVESPAVCVTGWGQAARRIAYIELLEREAAQEFGGLGEELLSRANTQ